MAVSLVHRPGGTFRYKTVEPYSGIQDPLTDARLATRARNTITSDKKVGPALVHCDPLLPQSEAIHHPATVHMGHCAVW